MSARSIEAKRRYCEQVEFVISPYQGPETNLVTLPALRNWFAQLKSATYGTDVCLNYRSIPIPLDLLHPEGRILSARAHLHVKDYSGAKMQASLSGWPQLGLTPVTHFSTAYRSLGDVTIAKRYKPMEAASGTWMIAPTPLLVGY